MEAAYFQTVQAHWGKVCFSFAADGTLVEISTRPRRELGIVGKRPKNAPSASAVRTWLKHFEKGQVDPFPGPWQMPGDSEFRRQVYQAVFEIPAGQKLSYGEVAAKAGSPRAFRAVGTAMGQNPLPLLIP